MWFREGVCREGGNREGDVVHFSSDACDGDQNFCG